MSDAEVVPNGDSVETTPTEPTDERDELIKAAQEADAPEGEAPKEAPKKKEKANGESEEKPLSKLAGVLRAREQAQKLREEGEKERQEAQKLRQEAEQLKQEYAQAIAEARKEREQLALLKRDPMRAIKEIGWSADDLIQGVIRENTPEWQALSKAEQAAEKDRSELHELRQMVKDLVERDTHAREQNQVETRKLEREFTVKKFLTDHVSEEKCPSLRALYDDDEIVQKGDRVADLFRERTGKVAPLADIAEYLESEAEKRLLKLRGEKRGNGHAPKPLANGPRTLTAASASERRAVPKSIRELSPEEERDALIAAAKEATRDLS